MKKYVSNRLEDLCQQLATNISSSDGSVFSKDIIITQTEGMNAWLKTELAQRNRVLAQFEFQNQDGMFAQLYKLLLDKPISNQFDQNKYAIYNLLSKESFSSQFPHIAQYYTENSKRRFELATKIADLFDQYQLYRPEIISAWDNNRCITDHADENWQQWLWKKLEVQSKEKRKVELIDALEANKELICKKYPRISLFGISIFTPFHYDFFKTLALYTSVEIYICLPTNCGEFKNDLLISYGAKAKEMIELVGISEVNIQHSNNDTFLGHLQNSVFTNSSAKPALSPDNSIQVNSCYTPVRELECVYNYLLNLFEKDTTLRPRDVLVITTEIDIYAPFAKAVFRNAPVKIPIQVSGVKNTSVENIISTLEQILTFSLDDLSSEKVVSLLEEKRIKKQFQIADSNYIRTVVNKANIRFGKSNNDYDDTQFVSWDYGLEKLLLGYAMLTDEEYDGKFPFKDAEASASHDLLKLKYFFDNLYRILDAEKTNRTLADWKLFLFDEVIGKMIFIDDFSKDDRAEISSIYYALSFIDQLNIDEVVPFALFLSELKSKLFTKSTEIKLNTGRVTITSPIAVRGIPYKVICFLGLNNGIFPRQDRFMGFDLMGDYNKFDRSKKDTDKLLFLDTLLAARQKLYLSYIGQSSQDNSEIPSSIVLDTLLEYTKIETIKHPLHGFGAKYQANNERLFTYLYSPKAISFEPKEPTKKELTEITLNSFLKFFEHPIKWYFNTILDIFYENNNDSLPETELFELNGGLEKWAVKEDLMHEPDIEIYLTREIKQGKLPLKSMGRLTVEDQLDTIFELKTKYNSLIADKKEETVVVDITIDSVRITGTINNVFDRKFVAYTVSKNTLKHKAVNNLKALLLCAENKIDSAIFINLNGAVTDLTCLSSAEAKHKLKELMAYIKMGRLTPLKFCLEAAEVALKSKKTSSDVLAKFKEIANGNPYNNTPPDPYLLQLFEEDYFNNFDEKNLDVIIAIANLLDI